MNAALVTLVAGWVSILGGVASGMLMGLRFHREEWLGGYASFPRRLVRLGHIAFFGIGFLNLLFAASVCALPVTAPFGEIAAAGFVLAAMTMSPTCFLAAWRVSFRHLFPIPVVAVFVGILSLLAGWALS
jgi:hypothetical protein